MGASPSHSPHLPCHSPSLVQPISAHSPSLMQPHLAHSPSLLQPPLPAHSPLPGPPPHLYTMSYASFPADDAPLDMSLKRSSSPDRRYYSPHHYPAPASPSPPPPPHHPLLTGARPTIAEDVAARLPPPPPSYSVATAHLREKRPPITVPVNPSIPTNNNNNISMSNRNGVAKSDGGRTRQVVVRRSAAGAVDPEIDEHFRRSLGKTYHHIFDAAVTTPSVEPAPVVAPAPSAAASPGRDVRHKKQIAPPQALPQQPRSPPRVPSTDSVDDHFAKALGATWTELQARRNGTPPPPPSYSSATSRVSSTITQQSRLGGLEPNVSAVKTGAANGVLRPNSASVSTGRFNGNLVNGAPCSPVNSLATLSIVPVDRNSSSPGRTSPSASTAATITRVVTPARLKLESNSNYIEPVMKSQQNPKEIAGEKSPPTSRSSPPGDVVDKPSVGPVSTPVASPQSEAPSDSAATETPRHDNLPSSK
ncbi:atrophin-1 [Hyalella azteca]|uniref:Atrophin-1 n=1 Tax=Hyalella azteca TaxID=294128 RepID=A0A8B7NI12_HYAAZ|nr:atrophin-1 [Hyalella azteca]